MKTKEIIQKDLFRITGKNVNFLSIIAHLHKSEFRYVFFLRYTCHFKQKRSLISYLFYPILRYYAIKHGYDIPHQTQIDPGFRLIHFGAIAINPLAVIGSNVTIFKGVTI